MTGWAVLLLCGQAAASPLGSDPPRPEGAPLPLVAAVSIHTAPGARGPTELPLGRDGESVVETGARFRVEVGAAVAEARLALYDAQDALVPAEDSAVIGSTSSRFTLVPARPLRAGARYLLRLEGATGRDVRDLSGRAYRPLAFSLSTPALPPPPRPPRKRPGATRG